MIGSIRVSKYSWYRDGGFSNPRNWRRMRGGSWHYYRRYD